MVANRGSTVYHSIRADGQKKSKQIKNAVSFTLSNTVQEILSHKKFQEQEKVLFVNLGALISKMNSILTIRSAFC